jgi:hypothetical protein
VNFGSIALERPLNSELVLFPKKMPPHKFLSDLMLHTWEIWVFVG